MHIARTFDQCQNYKQMIQLFQKEVTVSIGWKCDKIQIEGCNNYLSSDEITDKIRSMNSGGSREEGKDLAQLLKSKVFEPLHVQEEKLFQSNPTVLKAYYLKNFQPRFNAVDVPLDLTPTGSLGQSLTYWKLISA